MDKYRRIYVNCDPVSGDYEHSNLETYLPDQTNEADSKSFGHGGSDFYTMYNFVEKILGNPEADTIDVYEALDMFLPGLFAYRSILNGNARMEIPNLRDKSIRDQWRNDTACTDPKVAGDQLIPTTALGTPKIDAAIYESVREKWLKELQEKKDYTTLYNN